MSADYAAVIADLEAKRDGLTDLIAALRNVSRMQPGQLAVPVVVPTLPLVIEPLAVAPPKLLEALAADLKADAQEDRIVAFVNTQREGVSLSGVAAWMQCDTTEARRLLKRLVASGRITNSGWARTAKYWPAGTTAKEAL